MYNSNIFNTLKSTPATKQQHWITAQSTTQHDYQHHHQDLGFSVIIFVVFLKKEEKKRRKSSIVNLCVESTKTIQQDIFGIQRSLTKWNWWRLRSDCPGNSQQKGPWKAKMDVPKSHNYISSHNPSQPGFMQKQHVLPGNNASPGLLVI